MGNDRKKLPILVLMFLCLSVLDLAGIGLIAPYVGLIINTQNFMQGDIAQTIISFGFPSDSYNLTLVLGIAL